MTRTIRSRDYRAPRTALLKTETLLGVMALSFILVFGVSALIWGMPT